MSLRAQRGNRTHAKPPCKFYAFYSLCIVCDCFVPRNDIFVANPILLLFRRIPFHQLHAAFWAGSRVI
ncbi:MAG: hypothetical protein JWR09_2015 [Mucilaginibacter sp.]|nr:hypothetical protein [Mucilaginibacter sp.]